MKKKLLYVACIALLLSVGCASPSKENKEPEKEAGAVGKEEPEKEPESEKGEEVEKPEKNESETSESVTVRVFHTVEDSEDIKETEVEISKLDAGEIWNELVVYDVVPLDSVVNNFQIDTQDASKAVLDIDASTGDYIRGMGTFGESRTIACIINTYAYAYNCEKIRITENGATFETGHAVLDGYIEKQ